MRRADEPYRIISVWQHTITIHDYGSPRTVSIDPVTLARSDNTNAGIGVERATIKGEEADIENEHHASDNKIAVRERCHTDDTYTHAMSAETETSMHTNRSRTKNRTLMTKTTNKERRSRPKRKDDICERLEHGWVMSKVKNCIQKKTLSTELPERQIKTEERITSYKSTNISSKTTRGNDKGTRRTTLLVDAAVSLANGRNAQAHENLSIIQIFFS